MLPNNVSLIIDSLELGNRANDIRFVRNQSTLNAHSLQTEFEQYITGAIEFGLQVTAFQDFATNKLDDKIGTLVQSGAAVTVTLLLSLGESVSESNPQLSGSMYVSSYSPTMGGQDEESKCKFTLHPVGDITLSLS